MPVFSPVTIGAIDLYLLDLPLHEPMVASHGRTTTRPVTIIKVTADSTGGTVGWGECSALPDATYTAETAADSFLALADLLAPLLVGATVSADEVADILSASGGPGASRPMAVSGLEMAVADAGLRADGISLAEALGADRSTVPAGISIGLDTVDRTVERVAQSTEAGYRRVKLKVEPGHDDLLVAAVRAARPEVELHVDANGAYQPDQADHVVAVAERGVDAFEQPFGRDEPAAAAKVISRLGDRSTVVVADEAVQSEAEAQAVLAQGAMTGLSIKPARVGGLLAAARLHDLCRRANLSATAGGMLETGLGRNALAALAALDGFDLTGDLSPAARWLAADPFPDLVLNDGAIAVHRGPGVAPEPDLELLERLTTSHRRLTEPLPHPGEPS
jgi:O-succinylbenzoate synthase